MAINVSNLAIQLTADASKAVSGLKKVNKKLDGTKSAVASVGKTVIKYTGITTFSIAKISSGITLMSAGIKGATKLYNKFGDEIKDSLKMSMEYIENLNLFNVSMGEASAEAMKFQNTINEAFGTNLSNTVRYQAVFQQMASAIGLANKEAKLLSETMTKLGYDIASFYNIEIEDAMSKLQAGLAGQTKPLRSLGMDITQQTMQPVLESLGITDRSVSQLTQAEKMILRYITILRQSKNAQTDMARTLDQPANQLRILNEQVKETGRWFGNVFIGTFGAILPYINAVVMVLKELLKALATLGGFQDYVAQFSGSSAIEIPDGEDLSDNLGEAEKKSKKIHDNLQSIDEVHNLTEDSDSSSGAGVSIGGVDSRLLEAMKGYDNLMGSVNSKANEVRDKLMAWLGFTKQINEETNEIYFTYTGNGWSDVGVKLTEAFDYATTFLVQRIKSVPWSEIAENFNLAFSNLDMGAIASNFYTIIGESLLGVQDLLLGIDFGQLTQKISEGVTSAFKTIGSYAIQIDFGGLAKQIQNAFMNIDFDSMFSSVSGIAKALAKGILDAVANIDFISLAQKASESVNGIMQTIGNTMREFDWITFAQEVIDGIVDFLLNIDWFGLLMGVFDLIISALVVLGEVLIGVVLGVFESLWEGITSFLSPISDWIADLMMKIEEFWTGTIKPFLDNVKDGFKKLTDNIIGFWKNNVVPFFQGIPKFFLDTFNKAKDWAWEKVNNLLTSIKGLPNKIGTALKSIPEKFRQAFQNAKNKVSEIWKSVTTMFSKGGQIFDGIKEGIAETFKSIVNTLIIGINKVIAKPFEAINNTLNSIRNTNIPVIDVKPFKGLWDKNPIPVPQIPQLATGGFPDKGSLFIANEKAPELVGNIGNNTAVVNNEQIVQSVSRGVAQAVAGALANGSGEQEIVGEIDGEKLIKIVVKGVNGMTTKNGKFPFKMA